MTAPLDLAAIRARCAAATPVACARRRAARGAQAVRCKHKRTDTILVNHPRPLPSVLWLRCWGCGAALPMGAANDAPTDPDIADAMRIEQRALEWIEFAPMEVTDCVCSGCQTRHLVNAIASHDSNKEER